MLIIEIILLIIAYTTTTLALFLEIICYKRKLEIPETIAFTLSLLLLIIALSSSPLLTSWRFQGSTHVFTLLAMILVGLTTPLNILAERQIQFHSFWRKGLFGLAGILFLTTIFAQFMHWLGVWQYIVVVFLGASVVVSMLLVRMNPPQKRIMHREKIERLFAIAFLVLVPLSLLIHYLFEEAASLKIGFTLPLVFILLSGSKLFDDLQRLGIVAPKIEPKDQHFINYALSDREKEIAILLTQGKSYKQIAEELYISMPTVKTHVSNIYKKCGINSRSKLMALLIN